MASPSATGGRTPAGTEKGTQKHMNQTETQPVHAVEIGLHLQSRLSETARIAATKIDTEGFEPRVLAALRPVWDRMGDVVLELQPHAWQLHGIPHDEAFATLRAFGMSGANGYVVVTLPHAQQFESSTLSNPALYSMVDACRLQPVVSGVDRGISAATRPPSMRKAFARPLKTSMGMKAARVMSVDQLIEGLRGILDSKHKHFHEVLLTRRRGCERTG